MVNLIGPALVAFVLATAIAGLELVTSKYPRTFSFIKKHPWLYVYALVHGVLGLGIMLGLDALMKGNAVGFAGPLNTGRWGWSIAVGFSTKALLNIRLFTVSTGSQSFPVGIESFVKIFEPTLLQTIDLHEFCKIREFLEPRARKYEDLSAVKQKILSELPQNLAADEKTAFATDIEKAVSVILAMEIYLRRFGRGNFDRVFPPPQAPPSATNTV